MPNHIINVMHREWIFTRAHKWNFRSNTTKTHTHRTHTDARTHAASENNRQQISDLFLLAWVAVGETEWFTKSGVDRLASHSRYRSSTETKWIVVRVTQRIPVDDQRRTCKSVSRFRFVLRDTDWEWVLSLSSSDCYRCQWCRWPNKLTKMLYGHGHTYTRHIYETHQSQCAHQRRQQKLRESVLIEHTF